MRPTAEQVREVLAYDPHTGQFAWKVARRPQDQAGCRAGTTNKAGYICIAVLGYRAYAHRLAVLLTTGEWPAECVDHINGIKADNRIKNLRATSQAVNLQNQRKARSDNKSTGVLGVTRKKDRFSSEIWVFGKRTYLGAFDTVSEAKSAYMAAKRRLHEGCTI